MLIKSEFLKRIIKEREVYTTNYTVIPLEERLLIISRKLKRKWEQRLLNTELKRKTTEALMWQIKMGLALIDEWKLRKYTDGVVSIPTLAADTMHLYRFYIDNERAFLVSPEKIQRKEASVFFQMIGLEDLIQTSIEHIDMCERFNINNHEIDELFRKEIIRGSSYYAVPFFEKLIIIMKQEYAVAWSTNYMDRLLNSGEDEPNDSRYLVRAQMAMKEVVEISQGVFSVSEDVFCDEKQEWSLYRALTTQEDLYFLLRNYTIDEAKKLYNRIIGIQTVKGEEFLESVVGYSERTMLDHY